MESESREGVLTLEKLATLRSAQTISRHDARLGLPSSLGITFVTRDYLRHWGLPSSPGITFVTLVKKIMVLLESEPSLNFGFATLFSRSHQNCSTPQPPNGERTRTKLCNKSRMRRELRV